MYERVDDLSKTLPRPALGERRLNDVIDQHVLNAHRMRAEAIRRHAIAASRLFWSMGRSVRRLGAVLVRGWISGKEAPLVANASNQ